VAGGYAYVTDYQAGLRVVDVSNPSAPFEAGYCDTPGNAIDVAVVGEYAYIADDYAGLRVVDVSNAAAPFEVGYYDTPGNAYGVAAGGGFAYVADLASGLRVVDVSNPAQPVEVAYYDAPGPARGVAVAGGLTYLADTTGGLFVLRVYAPVDAQFTGSPTSGLPPLFVAFTNGSTGDFDTCAWTFGDGGTSTDCGNPTHTYTAAGVYTVALAVSGPGGTDTHTRPDYIQAFFRVYLPAVLKEWSRGSLAKWGDLENR